MRRGISRGTSTRPTSPFWSQESAPPTLELLESAPDLDVLFVPVGGGSGILGAGIVARAVNPAIRVVGVQAEGAPAVYRSWREGRRVVTDSVNTFAEGLATREPFDMPLALFPRLVDEMVLVSDVEIAAAIRLLLVRPPARSSRGPAQRPSPPPCKERDQLAGKNVGLIVSGGNITIDQLSRVINHECP